MAGVIAFNYKTYDNVFGTAAEKYAMALREVASIHSEVTIIACPPQLELAATARKFPSTKNFWVFAQNADPVGFGSRTGWTPVEAVAASGAVGTLVNHAEHKVPLDTARKVVEQAKKSGVKVIACAADLKEAKDLAALAPWAVAVEPPELIGSGVSVSKAQPEIVKKAVAVIKETNPAVLALVGAGVSNAEDVRKAVQLGAEGVLLASAFVKAANPKEFAESLAEAAAD
ncbi:MAG: triose-phosphate isomerase [Candidatus Norongarragalinales archaeon]